MKLGTCDLDPHGEEARYTVSNRELSGEASVAGCLGPVKEYGPHPEELAKQASRRMEAWHGLAAILRDAREGALLRMRSE
jgi:hypothetical protein